VTAREQNQRLHLGLPPALAHPDSGDRDASTSGTDKIELQLPQAKIHVIDRVN
jgi:hypothetical protein